MMSIHKLQISFYPPLVVSSAASLAVYVFSEAKFEIFQLLEEIVQKYGLIKEKSP